MKNKKPILIVEDGEANIVAARKYLELSSEKGWKPADKLLDNNDLITGPAVLNFWEDYILEDQED